MDIKDTNFGSVRIENSIPSQVEIGFTTREVWFEEHNVEECIAATEKLGIQHIHLQTNTIDFLHDPRLKKVKGITMQFGVENIEPLFRFLKAHPFTLTGEYSN